MNWRDALLKCWFLTQSNVWNDCKARIKPTSTWNKKHANSLTSLTQNSSFWIDEVLRLLVNSIAIEMV